MSTKTTDLQNAFIVWSLKPVSERGAIDTETAWAEKHKVSTRTLRRWKTLPEFQARLTELSEARSVTSVTEQTTSADEGDYQVVKAALVEGAKQGNPKYLELYFKTYGKPFVEEEAASRSSDLTGLDLEDLVSKALVAVGPEVVAGQLRKLGWRCEGP
jgi:hypothetical protein